MSSDPSGMTSSAVLGKRIQSKFGETHLGKYSLLMALEVQEIPNIVVKSSLPPCWELEACCAARDKEYLSLQLPSSSVAGASWK